MSFISKHDLNRIVGQAYKSTRSTKAITDAILEQSGHKNQYDIFLSHSYSDKETILQLNYLLEEELGLSVFVDWIESPELDRSKVTPSTAAKMRDIMNRCTSLVYAISTTSSDSKWMPWELGYSDAQHGRVAVLPIADSASSAATYRNQEFVGIYPYIQYDTISGDYSGKKHLWVYDPLNQKKYSLFSVWKSSGVLNNH